MNEQKLLACIDDPQERATVSAVALTDALLDRIERYQPAINAFITVMSDYARHEAERVDDARDRGHRLGPLDGLIVAVKDDIDVAGVRCTIGSRFFADRIPDQDADVVRRLRNAGAIIVGKTALHEFAYGATTINPHYGACRNPWDTTRIPGGSSGGSGAALAADLCIGALGSDGGGSVRIPASLNGVTGLRPTLGSISGDGVFPIVWSFETVGPMARSVGDVAALYEVLRQAHPSTAVSATLEEGIDHLRIGMPSNFFFDGIDPEVETAVRAAAEALEHLGASVSELQIPRVEEVIPAVTVVSRAEALAMHRERFENNPELFGTDVYDRLALGTAISGAELAAEFHHMGELRQSLREVFSTVDMILSPTTDAVAPKIEDSDMIPTTANLTRLTWPWSLAGVPAISLPCGFSNSGLPIGLQLAAGLAQEPLLLRAAAVYQNATDWHRRRPPVEPHTKLQRVHSADER